MVKLPEVFCTVMQSLLKDEYEAYMLSYEQPRYYGLRVNTTKVSAAQLEELGLEVEPQAEEETTEE